MLEFKPSQTRIMYCMLSLIVPVGICLSGEKKALGMCVHMCVRLSWRYKEMSASKRQIKCNFPYVAEVNPGEFAMYDSV